MADNSSYISLMSQLGIQSLLEGDGDLTTKYMITGVDKDGKRFSPIHTNTPQHYNIWRGTIWEKLEDGTRKKIKEIFNG